MKKKFARSLTSSMQVTREHAESFFLNHVSSVDFDILYAYPQDIDSDYPVFELRHCTGSLDELYVYLLDFLLQLYQYYIMGVEFGSEYNVRITVTPKVGKPFVISFPLC